MRRFMKLTAVVALLAGGGVACQPQQEGTLVIEGDSITWGWMLSGGGDGAVHATPGASINWCPDGWFKDCVPPNEHLAATTQAGRAAIVEVRLGTNDTANGWDERDETAWTATLQDVRNRSEPDSCVVLVLPWLVAPVSVERLAEVDEARAWLVGTGLPTVDWRPYMERPGVAGPDGVHLTSVDGLAEWPVYTTEAAAAMQDSHEEALTHCE